MSVSVALTGLPSAIDVNVRPGSCRTKPMMRGSTNLQYQNEKKVLDNEPKHIQEQGLDASVATKVPNLQMMCLELRGLMTHIALEGHHRLFDGIQLTMSMLRELVF